jgi:plasmid stabilization system protein ParE
MAFKIIWTTDGLKSFDEVLNHLSGNFTEHEIQRFVQKVNQKLTLAQGNPLIYRRSDKFTNVHYTIVLKKVLLVYRVKPRKQVIEVLKFWNARQNPKKFKSR